MCPITTLLFYLTENHFVLKMFYILIFYIKVHVCSGHALSKCKNILKAGSKKSFSSGQCYYGKIKNLKNMV